MRLRQVVALGPVLLGVAVVGLFFGELLRPDLALAGRDYPFLHLPFRAALRELAQLGVPWWNPAVHGGQPILSNPHYAAFYPPTWLTLPLPPHYALSVLVVLHAGLAFAGAFRLARFQRCSRAAAALAATGTVAGGASLSLAELFNLFCGMAWFPWVLLTGAQACGERRDWARPAILCGWLWGLQLLNGEPMSALMSGLGLAAIWASGAAWRRNAARLLVPTALCLLIACAQLVPTLHRVGETRRGGGLAAAEATAWSTHPGRLAELVLPHLLGDASRVEESLFFGAGINDRGFPLLPSLYPGLLIVLLALVGAVAARSPARVAWGLAAVGGLLLASGHHNPVSDWLWRSLPVLRVQRYPEKLMALTAAGLVFLAALGWDRLMRDRRGAASRLLLGGALGALAVATLLSGVLLSAGERVGRLLRQVVPGPAPAVEAALAYSRREMLIRVVVALLAVGFALLVRRSRSRPRIVVVAGLSLLLADLWTSGRRLAPTVPAELLTRPAALAERLHGTASRIYVRASTEAVGVSSAAPGERQLRQLLGRLEPVCATVWGVSYALHEDYDLTLTRWGRHARRLFEAQPASSQRLLGAWNVGFEVVPRGAAELYREWRATGADPLPARLLPNPRLEPRFRFAERFTTHPTAAEAVAAAVRDGFAGEHLIAADQGPLGAGGDATLHHVADSGASVELDYTAPAPAVLVAAMTFDDDWTATVDGAPRDAIPTALGQLAVVVPAGSHRLRLAYRDPWVGLGVGVTLVAFLASLIVWRRLPGARPQTQERR